MRILIDFFGLILLSDLYPILKVVVFSLILLLCYRMGIQGCLALDL